METFVELTKKTEALAKKKMVFLKKQVVLKFHVIPDSSAVIEKSRPSRRKLGMQNLLLDLNAHHCLWMSFLTGMSHIDNDKLSQCIFWFQTILSQILLLEFAVKFVKSVLKLNKVWCLRHTLDNSELSKRKIMPFHRDCPVFWGVSATWHTHRRN